MATYRFTTRTLFLITALIAAVAGVARIGGINRAMSLVLALLGLLFLIRSGRAEAAPEVALMILVGLGLLAWAGLNLLPKIY